MTISERILSRPIYLAAIVAVVAFVVYSFTLAPGVDFIDAGELATDCWVLGICHPTGYPLFTIVGWVFSHLPIASSVILRMNIMAAFFTATGAGMVVLLANEVFRYWMPARQRPVKTNSAKTGQGTKSTKATRGTAAKQENRRVKDNPIAITPGIAIGDSDKDGTIPTLAAFATGLAAAFSSTWWSQSTSIEVYPLHLFMVPMVLTFFLRMLRKEEGFTLGRDGKLFALSLALSFANHMTTVLIAPACLYMFFARYGFSQISWKRILRLAPFFIGGLLLYLYLPIRSALYPIMDWGHPANFGAFLRHVTGGQYKIWMFTGAGAAAKQWAYFWHRVPIEFTIVGAFAAIVGIYVMFMSGSVKRTHVLIFTLLLFFGCLFYSINYDIHDIDSYFLLAYLAVALWIGAGLLTLVNLAKQEKKEWLIIGAALVLAGVEISVNYADVDESGNHFVDDYTTNMLTNLPLNAIIFSTQWDFWVSGAFYYQLVEKVRPDVLVIDKAMLRDRPWYFAELAQRAPEVFRRVKPEEDAFLRLLWKFDRGEQFDQAAIAPAYEQFTSALVERNLDRPIFVTQEMLDQPDDLFAPKMKAVPAGIAYRLLPTDSSIESDVPKLQWRDADYRKRDYYTDDSRTLQALPLANYAQKLLQRGETARAKQFFDAALTFSPDLGAKLDDLNERDRSVAEGANEKFTQIAALRKQLNVH
jgi:hypothetical protein